MSNVNIVMYHYVRDLEHSRYPRIKGLDLSLFEQQIQFFKQHFTFITMEELLSTYEEGGDLPENALLLTFDDGYMDHFTNVFPVLLREGIQGSFFISGKTFIENKLLDVNKIHFVLASSDTNELLQDLYQQMDYYRGIEYNIPSNKELYDLYAVKNRYDDKDTIFIKRMLQTVLPEELRNKISSNIFEKYVGLSEFKFAHELYMSYDQIRCMKNAGMFIGLHGYDHYWLGNLEKDKAEIDIRKALKSMNEFINPNSWVMNYPYGSYNNETIDILKNMGCKLALTTNVNIANSEREERFEIPRLDTNDYPPKSNNYLNIWNGV